MKYHPAIVLSESPKYLAAAFRWSQRHDIIEQHLREVKIKFMDNTTSYTKHSMLSSENESKPQCPLCGYEYEYKARYCIQCGASLNGDSAAVRSPEWMAAGEFLELGKALSSTLDLYLLLKKIDDLCFYCHIQGGCWFISNQQIRFTCKCDGDHGPLPHSSTQLVGVFMHSFFR